MYSSEIRMNPETLVLSQKLSLEQASTSELSCIWLSSQDATAVVQQGSSHLPYSQSGC